jgi:hypothetical protein
MLPTNLIQAETIKLSWDPNQEPDLAGYKLYYSFATTNTAPDPYVPASGAVEGPSPITVGNVTTFTITMPADSKIHFFAVTAYNTADLESSYSNYVIAYPTNINVPTLTTP